MKFFRHSNGSGKKYVNADVSDDTLLDKTSFAGENTHIWASSFIHSFATGECDIDASILTNTQVEVNRASITVSRVTDSQIAGMVRIKNSDLFNTKIDGEDVIIRDASVSNCNISGHVIIDPQAVVTGLTLHSHMRLGKGVWITPPRYTEVKTDGGSHFGVTEAKNGYAYIGCNVRPMASWIKKRKLWARVDKWDEETREGLRRTFEEWMDIPNA